MFETQITEFYKGVTQSSHFDWMSEYCTPTQGPIGRGSGNDFITLSGYPTKSDIDNDEDIIPYVRPGVIKLTYGYNVKTNPSRLFPYNHT